MVTRGGSLSHPAVVAVLSPFIVCQWFGNTSEIPSEFARRLPRGHHAETTFFLVYDTAGEFVHAFPGIPQSNEMARARQHVLAEIQAVLAKLTSSDATQMDRKIRLPDVPVGEGGSRRPSGVRVLVRNLDRDPSKAGAQSPVFEIVTTRAEDWAPFAWTENARILATESIQPWISVAYPPAKFEMVGRSSFPNTIVAGKLAWRPAGSDDRHRYALATGDLTLVLEGRDRVEYGGRIEIVLTYDLDSSEIRSIRGVILGTYPSYDVGKDRSHDLRFAALFESRPE